MKLRIKYLMAAAAFVGALNQSSWADNTAPNTSPTAFTLIKKGDDFIGVQARDKIVAAHSEKSVDGLTPDVWYIDYYDPTATLKSTEVKFGNGQMLEVKRPLHLLEPVTGKSMPMDWADLKVDSDRALDIALKDPLLHRVHLRATQDWLERTDVGPAWKIRFYAAKVDHPDDSVDIGELYISSETGEVVKNALHINSVD